MSGDEEIIFHSNRKKQWRSILIAGGFVAVALFATLHEPQNSGRRWILALCGAFFASLIPIMLLSILRGLPRLTVNQSGVTLHRLFRDRSVTWDRLGDFGVISRAVSRRKEVLSAAAPMIGSSDAPDKAPGRFLIPDSFQAPLTTIVAEISARRVGVTNETLRFAQDPTMAGPAIGVAGFRWPWLTILGLLTFVAVFVIEQYFAVSPGGKDLRISPATLLALGGLSRPLVMAGEWYRLLTAPFLHLSAVHLVGNGIAFVYAGYCLEGLIGRAWTVCLFAGGAVAGFLTSLVFLPTSAVSVGASGGIMAMLLGLMIIGTRLPVGALKTKLISRTAGFSIPALIPAAGGPQGIVIDYTAHFGGAVFGALFGFWLIRTWRENEPLPRFRFGAQAIALISVLMITVSASAVAWRYSRYSIMAHLIPNAELPHGAAEMRSKADHLLAVFPQDPRSHFVAGLAKLQAGDSAGAEREFRVALPLAETTEPILGVAITDTIRVSLASTILEQGREQEAKVMLQDLCGSGRRSGLNAQASAMLAKFGLCNDIAGLAKH